jgi:hypothetical protein
LYTHHRHRGPRPDGDFIFRAERAGRHAGCPQANNEPAHAFPFGIRIDIQKQAAEKRGRPEVNTKAIAL